MKNLVEYIKESKRRLGDYTKNELIKMGYHVQLDGKVFDKNGKYIGDMTNKDSFLYEGFFDFFKIQKQFTELQADVTAKYEETKSESALKKYAEEAFSKYITNEKAISFKEWWPDFYKALTRFNK